MPPRITWTWRPCSQNYPNIHVTFNLTPSLIRQLDDLAAGAKDLYWVLAEVPADELTDEQKRFILERFFDTNRKIIARFPRYQELLDMRDGRRPRYDRRPGFPRPAGALQPGLDRPGLAGRGAAGMLWWPKAPNYSEADKQTLFAEHLA